MRMKPYTNTKNIKVWKMRFRGDQRNHHYLVSLKDWHGWKNQSLQVSKCKEPSTSGRGRKAATWWLYWELQPLCSYCYGEFTAKCLLVGCVIVGCQGQLVKWVSCSMKDREGKLKVPHSPITRSAHGSLRKVLAPACLHLPHPQQFPLWLALTWNHTGLGKRTWTLTFARIYKSLICCLSFPISQSWAANERFYLSSQTLLCKPHFCRSEENRFAPVCFLFSVLQGIGPSIFLHPHSLGTRLNLVCNLSQPPRTLSHTSTAATWPSSHLRSLESSTRQGKVLKVLIFSST